MIKTMVGLIEVFKQEFKTLPQRLNLWGNQAYYELIEGDKKILLKVSKLETPSEFYLVDIVYEGLTNNQWKIIEGINGKVSLARLQDNWLFEIEIQE